MRLKERRWVENPRDQVFEFTADFSNIHQWDPGVVSSAKIGNGSVGLGTKYELEVRFGVSTLPMTYEITEYEEPSKVVLVGEGRSLEAIDEIRFSDQDNMTRIDYTADLQFRGFMRYLAPVLSPVMRRVGTRALDGLVEALAR